MELIAIPLAFIALLINLMAQMHRAKNAERRAHEWEAQARKWRRLHDEAAKTRDSNLVLNR